MTAISSALELLNSYIASNDEAILTQLKDALLECDNTDSSLHDSFFKQCKKEFGEKLWNCLDSETQELIVGYDVLELDSPNVKILLLSL